MKFVKLAAVAAIASLTVTTAAQAEEGYYGTVSGGLLALKSQDDTSTTPTVTTKLSHGYALQGALGYGFGNGVRTELEVGYADSDIKSMSSGAVTTNVPGGDVDFFSAHAAAYYDFAVGSVAPYIGGGLGVTKTTVDAFTVAATVNPSDNFTDFSMFGEVGVGIPVRDGVTFVPAVRYVWVDTGNGGQDNTTGLLFKAAVRFAF